MKIEFLRSIGHSVVKENWKSFQDGQFDFSQSIWKGHDEQWIWAMSF